MFKAYTDLEDETELTLKLFISNNKEYSLRILKLTVGGDKFIADDRRS